MGALVICGTLEIPITFYEFTELIAPRPLFVGQAVGERRPMEEENYAAVEWFKRWFKVQRETVTLP